MTNEYLGPVLGEGWVVTTMPPDTNYWSADLGGLVSKLKDATWYPTDRSAVSVMEMRNLSRVAFVQKVARVRSAHEPSEQRPADGTRDGDGVWQGGFWHPDPPDPLDEWQLMEFAPKDGTRILALVTEVQFYRDTATPNELIPVVVKWTGEYSGWSMPGHGGLRPTLWLPIKLTNDPQGASRDASSTCPSIHDHMWRPAQHGEYCIRCNAQRTGAVE